MPRGTHLQATHRLNGWMALIFRMIQLKRVLATGIAATLIQHLRHLETIVFLFSTIETDVPVQRVGGWILIIKQHQDV